MTAPTGSTRDETSRKRRPWWLWLLLALAVVVMLAVLLFALFRCGSDSSPTATTDAASNPATTTAAPPSTTTPAGSGLAPPGTTGVGSPPEPGAVSRGSLTAGGTSLLPVAQVAGPNGDLSSQVGKAAMATGATVQSVPADEGFWLGTSDTDRVWVQLSGDGESEYVVRPGDRVEFTSQVVAHGPGFTGEVGVDAVEGADQLNRQGAHITVPMQDLHKMPR